MTIFFLYAYNLLEANYSIDQHSPRSLPNMRPIIPRTIYILAFFGILSVNTGWAENHEACSDCHKSSEPSVNNSDLIRPVETLCIECHKSSRPSDHVVGISPGPDGSGSLPLVNGKIDCITCHDSHAKDVMLLRFYTDELCLSCHLNH